MATKKKTTKMSKEKKLVDQMKHIILETEAKLEKALTERDHYQREYAGVCNARDKDNTGWRERLAQLEKQSQIERQGNRDTVMVLQDQIRNLMELMRWKTNPETAKYPFDHEINQRPKRDDGMGWVRGF